jgi:hypothetical protein
MGATKQATNDVEFEQRLQQLCLPQIKSKIPRLAPMMMGFELLNVNDDETEAAGIYAFRVGEQLVYVPVFFREGMIKGLNMLYLEKDDLFLPAEEEWISYIINREPYTVGKLTSREELNRDYRDTFSNVANAFGKTAADGRRAFQKMAAVATLAAHAKQVPDLEALLQRFPKSATLSLLNTMQMDDDFGRAVLQFYPFQKLAAIAEKIENNKRQENASADPINGKENQGIKYKRKPLALTSDDSGLLDADLTDDERKQIRVDGVAIRDDRDSKDVTDVLRTETPTQWFAPTHPGVYDLIDVKGAIQKAVIFTSVITVGDGSARCIVAVTKDKDGGVFAPGVMTATDAYPDEAWNRWHDELPTIGEADISDGDRFVLVTRDMRATPLLRAIGVKTKNSDDRTTTLFVDHTTHVELPRSSDLYGDSYGTGPVGYVGGNSKRGQRPGISMDNEPESTGVLDKYFERRIERGEAKASDAESYDYKRGRRITIVKNDETQEMETSGNQLLVSDAVRVLKLSKDDKDTARNLMAPCDSSLWPRIKQANAKFQKMVVAARGTNEYDISCGLVKSGTVNHRDAILHLVMVHGTNKAAAIRMMAEAQKAASKRKEAPVFAVKHADSYPDLDISSSAGGSGGVEETANRVHQDSGGGNPFLTEDIKSITNAAKSGEKSMFDTAVLVSLVRRHDIGAAIDELISPATLGIDSWCRALFLLYAHRQAFEDKYGTEDVPQLEDALENLIKESGEVLLILKKQSTEAESGLAEPKNDLEPSA